MPWAQQMEVLQPQPGTPRDPPLHCPPRNAAVANSTQHTVVCSNAHHVPFALAGPFMEAHWSSTQYYNQDISHCTTNRKGKCDEHLHFAGERGLLAYRFPYAVVQLACSAYRADGSSLTHSPGICTRVQGPKIPASMGHTTHTQRAGTLIYSSRRAETCLLCLFFSSSASPLLKLTANIQLTQSQDIFPIALYF